MVTFTKPPASLVVSDSFVYSIAVQFQQRVILERDRSISGVAVTWEDGSTGFVGEARLQGIRESVGNKVDIFINEYLTANPSTIPARRPSTTNR